MGREDGFLLGAFAGTSFAGMTRKAEVVRNIGMTRGGRRNDNHG